MPEENVPTRPVGSKSEDKLLDAVAAACEELKLTVIRNFGRCTWFNVKVCCSVIATLMLEDAANPVGLLLINAPASGKTTILSMFYGLPMVYRSDSFTPAAMVSNAANIRSEERLKKIDLLPKIKGKCLMVKDMASIFAQDKDQLQRSLAVLTIVFDGEGYKTDSGSHGARGYEGEYHFAMLGATPPIPNRVWQLMGQMGSRLLMLTADESLDPAERMAKSFSDVFDPESKSYKERVAECRQAVTEYFDALTAALCPNSFSQSMKWDTRADCLHLRYKINILADFVSRARSRVIIKDSKWKGDDDFDDYTQPLLESPHRLASLLYNVARGQAIICGRLQIAHEDLSPLIEIALSSMHQNRRQVVDLLLCSPGSTKKSERGTVSSTEIRDALTMSRPTALKILKQFELLGLGTCTRLGSNQPVTFTLHTNYDWLLSDEFARLRQPWERTD